MIPRGTPDIGWRDLLAALGYGLLPDAPLAEAAVAAAWAPDAIACLSVRSGFDLLLQELALPHGSEVLVSAVTIPDMLQIVRHHGLTPVPVDLDPHTLAPDLRQLRERITPCTRAILIAHLFGSRVALDPFAAAAREHALLLFEDCAQAFDGGSYRGHPAADCSMWSFGPIKTATALGGALLRVRDPRLRERMRVRQQGYPRQRRSAFRGRVARFGLLKALARPWLYGPLIALCRLRGLDHDGLINGAVRSFGGAELIPRLRQRPSTPLLRLLGRRLRGYDPARIASRAAAGRHLAAQLGAITRPGQTAAHQTHWVFPILSADPEALVRLLWAHGVDATRKASSLAVVPPHGRVAAPAAATILERLVYLPLQTAPDLARLAQIVTDFERRLLPAHRSVEHYSGAPIAPGGGTR